MDSTALFVEAPYIDRRIREYCYKRAAQAAEEAGISIVRTSQPEGWPIGHLSLYRNLMFGLGEVKTEYVFICEHDCIYTAKYFEYMPDMEYSYSRNIEYLTRRGFVRRKRENGTISTLYGRKDVIIGLIYEKIAEYHKEGRVKWAEPGNCMITRDAPCIIDIRHASNFTGRRNGNTYKHDQAKAIWEAIERQ